MKQLVWLATILMLLILAVSFNGLQAKDTKTCFLDDDDGDNDGYSRDGAPKQENVPVKSSEKLNCPSGYVRFENDCDDTKSDIHPRRDEIAGDGKDNKCNGKTDEPDFVYFADNKNNWVTQNSFKIKMKLKDARVYSFRSSLEAKVFYASLSRTQTVPEKRVPVQMQHEGSNHYGIIEITELVPNNVYRARVEFYGKGSNKRIGDGTDWYYTSTSGPSAEDQMRTNVVLRAFYELNESNLGKVGYKGTSKSDGTKYGANSKELWCSEFYSWVNEPYVKWMKNENSTSALISFFKNQGSYFSTGEIQSVGTRGDYAGMSMDDDSAKEHSGMFLAYDSSSKNNLPDECKVDDVPKETPVIWLIEGNVGNQVGIGCRNGNEVGGLGHVRGNLSTDISRKEAGESNEASCKQWCDAHAECARCAPTSGCGTGYDKIETFRGRGNNW